MHYTPLFNAKRNATENAFNPRKNAPTENDIPTNNVSNNSEVNVKLF